MDQFSIVIRNGKIVDGSGNPWIKSDIGIRDERIAIVGTLDKFQTEINIDAKGLLVCPGFIDVHTHSDISFFENPDADSKITQGVTTEIVGNCGGSAAPVTDLGKSFSEKRYEEKGIDWDWTTVSEFLRRLETNGLPVNMGTLIGHGTVRASVMGYENRDPTAKELREMKSLVEAGMKDGAFGLSTGLKYTPGSYAKTNEIIELCKVVHKYRGIYTTHLRNQGHLLIESVDEAIEIGRRSSVPVHISHLKVKGRNNWGKSINLLRIIDDARDSGVDVTFDQYPYPAGSTGLYTVVPGWAKEGGTKSLLERLKDPDQRKKIEAEVPEHEDWIGAENIIIVNFAPDTTHEGKSLKKIAELRNKAPVSVLCDLLLEANGNISRIGFWGWEEDIRNIMKHHAMMVGSDGSSLARVGSKGKPHPRSYGCYPRFFGRYVLQEGLLSKEDGIRRMTSFPAKRFGLTDRGLLHVNMFADIVILDPKKIIDVSTFEDPHQYSEGVEYVLVNGKIALENGNFTGLHEGKVLRHVDQRQ